MIDGVKSMDRAAPSHRQHCGARFPTEDIPVGLGHQAGPIDQGLHFRGNVRHIDRRAQDDSVRLGHLLDTVIDDVILDDTAPVLVAVTPVTGQAAVDRLATELDQLGLDAFPLELIKDLTDEDRSVPVAAGASIESNDFHNNSLAKPVRR